MSPALMAAREREPLAVDCRWGPRRNHSPAAHQGPGARPPVELREVEARRLDCRWGPDRNHRPATLRRATSRAGSPAARLGPMREVAAAPGPPARRRAPGAPRPGRRRAAAAPMRWGVGKHAYATPLPEATLLQPGLAARVPSRAEGACHGSGRYMAPRVRRRRFLADSLTSSGVSYAREAWPA
jgi:hypothetical protein